MAWAAAMGSICCSFFEHFQEWRKGCDATRQFSLKSAMAAFSAKPAPAGCLRELYLPFKVTSHGADKRWVKVTRSPGSQFGTLFPVSKITPDLMPHNRRRVYAFGAAIIP